MLKYNELTKWLMRSTVVLLLGLSIACNKKSSDNNNATAPYTPTDPYGTGYAGVPCQNCNFPQAAFINAQSQGTASFNVTLNWQLIGDQNILAQASATSTNPQTLYSGMVIANGTMVLAQNINATYCQLPAGQYQIHSVQAGQMSMGQFNLPQFEAFMNGVRILMSFSQGVVVDSNGDGKVDRIYGYLVPLQMNNQICNDMGVAVY